MPFSTTFMNSTIPTSCKFNKCLFLLNMSDYYMEKPFIYAECVVNMKKEFSKKYRITHENYRKTP